MKKLMAFDIDGTLTHRLDWIDPKVVDYLRSRHNEGWEIALLTGRIFSFGWQIFKEFDFPYLLAVQNGADILSMPEKTPLQRHYLSATLLPEIEKAYQGQEEDFVLYAGIDRGDFCYYRPDRYSEKMLAYCKKLESLGAKPWLASDFEFDKSESFPLIKCFGKQGPMEELFQKLSQRSDVEVSMIRDPIDRSLYLNLITHPRANKGSALGELRMMTGAEFVIAAGDDGNDLKMLKEADVAIAIETAPRAVLDAADIVAAPPTELGILTALEEAMRTCE